MMLARLLPLCCLVLGPVFATAQEAYTIGHYLRDRVIRYRVDSATTAGDPQLALQLHNTIQSRSPENSYWHARLEWEAGEPFIPSLRSAFTAGHSFIPDTTDAFHVANMDLLLQLRDEHRTLTDGLRIRRCTDLIERDLELASRSYTDTLAHRATVDTLDALIREGGWPSSYPLRATGVATVLAHQYWDQAHFFEPYQQLIEEECRASREDWTVALFTLQQRIRYTARNKTDTILFHNTALADGDPALPMVAAISDRLTSNGHRHLWIHAADSLSALAIAERIILLQPRIDVAPEVLEMLKAKHFDHPAPLTLERITFVIEPELDRKMFLYRMN